MTRGILDPATYYYRRVFTDAVRAVEAVRTPSDAVDAGRVARRPAAARAAASAIAAAGLVPDLAGGHAGRAVPVRLPARDDARRHEPVRRDRPLPEGAPRPRRAASRTLSYFDGAVLARAAKAPALFSVALMDDDLPAVDRLRRVQRVGGPEGDREYPYNDHEGGGGFHDRAKLRWLADRLAGSPAPQAHQVAHRAVHHLLRRPAVPRGRPGVVRLRRRLGHEVDFPAEQTCCGQIHLNSATSACVPLVGRPVAVRRVTRCHAMGVVRRRWSVTITRCRQPRRGAFEAVPARRVARCAAGLRVERVPRRRRSG